MGTRKKPDLPKGIECPKCGRWHPFSAWVYAHWTIPLKLHCFNKCKRVTWVQYGRIIG